MRSTNAAALVLILTNCTWCAGSARANSDCELLQEVVSHVRLELSSEEIPIVLTETGDAGITMGASACRLTGMLTGEPDAGSSLRIEFTRRKDGSVYFDVTPSSRGSLGNAFGVLTWGVLNYQGGWKISKALGKPLFISQKTIEKRLRGIDGGVLDDGGMRRR